MAAMAKARIKSQLVGFSTKLNTPGVAVAVGVGGRVRVTVGEGLIVSAGLGSGVSVGGRGVKVGVAGGVTCSSSLCPG